MTIDRVLCCVDFDSVSERAFSHAVDLAEQLGASLKLLHVSDVPQPIALAPPMATTPGGMTMAAAARPVEVSATVLARLEDWTERYAAQRVLTTRHVEPSNGSVGQTIIEWAEENDVHLIVVGSHGRKGVERLLLGSVAEEVVRNTTLPVMTVPYPDPE